MIRGAVLASTLGHHDLRPYAEMVGLITRREAHATRQMIKVMGNNMAEQRKVKLKKQVDEGKQRTCTVQRDARHAKVHVQCGRWWSMQKESFSMVGGGQCKRNVLVWSLAYQDHPVQSDGGKTTVMIISRSQGPSLSSL